MKRFGRVVAVSDIDRLPNVNSGPIWVEIEGLKACQRCARGQGCGSAMLNPQTSTLRLLCQSDFPVQESQHVTVSIDEPDSRWLWFVAGAYGLPLAGLLAGALLGTAIPSVIMQDAIVATSAVLGLIGGLIAWRYVSQRLAVWIETGLCLDSARIVAVSAASLETVR